MHVDEDIDNMKGYRYMHIIQSNMFMDIMHAHI